MYKRRIGVGAGLISYATLLAGRGGNRIPASSPTLILDFVGYLDPITLQTGSTFDANFVATPNPTYTVYAPDPSQPKSGITSYFVWN